MANYINANNNRYKTNQLYKVEKENENLELKKRMTNVYKERTQKKETVWDRLSRARRVPSADNMTQNRSRPNLASKPLHRFQIMKQMAAQQTQQQQMQNQTLQQNHQEQLYQQQKQHHHHHHHHHQQQQHQYQGSQEDLNSSPRRPLTPNSASNRQKSSRKSHMQKAIIMPEVENQGFVYVCKPVKSVKEIVTARSLTQSKSSLDDFKSPISISDDVDTQVREPSLTVLAKNDNGNDSSTDSSEYTLAPLISSRSHYNLLNSSSAKIVGHFHEVLRRRNQDYLEPEELELVKNVIKSDERYHQLDKSDPKLFKDILKTQLQDILKHEYAVKQALRKLDSTESIPSSRDVECLPSTKEIVHYEQNTNASSNKLEVDVVFRNVPSLEKEIIILRALGEKLDATLKRTESPRNLHVIEKRMLEKTIRSYILAIECHAQCVIRSMSIRFVKGIAQEFQIALKSIVELKEESNRSFYIPVDSQNAELKKTSFKKLKQNPDILIRHLKAKNSSVPFNVLEQDPVFFNNLFLKKTQKKKNKSPTKPKTEEQPTLGEGGDSRQFYEVKLKESTPNPSISNKIEPKKPLKVSEPLVRPSKNRRSIRRCLTPTSMAKSVSPKNNLFKTILVGSVQLSCFMLLIVAFTFPEAKC